MARRIRSDIRLRDQDGIKKLGMVFEKTPLVVLGTKHNADAAIRSHDRKIREAYDGMTTPQGLSAC
jgi:hypothetical protein